MQIYNKTQINEIVLALKDGKAAILPTDTVWGIVSLSENQIYQIKKRSFSKKISKFVASIEDIGLPHAIEQIVKPYMEKGTLSIVWKDVCYRIPTCSYLIDLLKLTGPLYQSSANISGRQPIVMSQQAAIEFRDSLNHLIIVDNSPWERSSNISSTIVSIDQMSVVREGPVSGHEVINAINVAKGQQ